MMFNPNSPENANLPRWRKPFKGSGGKLKKGFWYLFHGGKQINLTRYGAPRQDTKGDFKAAIEARQVYLLGLGLAEVEAEKPKTVAEIFANYEATALPKCKVGSAYIRQCPYYLAMFLDFIGKDKEAEKITKQDIERYKSQHQWAVSTTKSALSPIKAAYKMALEDGLVSVNPLAGLKLKHGLPREASISKEQETAFLTIAEKDNPAMAIFFKACIQLGARPSELATATVAHYNPKTFEIVLSSGEWKNGKKTNKCRYIALPPQWAAYVEERVNNATHPRTPLFTTARGCKWTQSSWVGCFKRIRDKAGLPKDISLYACRHTAITRALKAGIPIAHVAICCGTSINEIQNTYDKLYKDPENRMACVMAMGGC